MHVHGRCHCGGITYEADVDPASVQACHCTDCQTLSGSPYRVSVRAPAATFRLLSGQPTRYVKVADSGARRAHTFCPACGAPVYSSAEHDPVAYSLRVGCLRERDQLPPVKRIWCRSASPWSDDLTALPRSDRQ
jgi:hypothetical protein